MLVGNGTFGITLCVRLIISKIPNVALGVRLGAMLLGEWIDWVENVEVSNHLTHWKHILPGSKSQREPPKDKRLLIYILSALSLPQTLLVLPILPFHHKHDETSKLGGYSQ